MKMLNIRVLPRGWDADHVRFSGEPIFCDFWDYLDDPAVPDGRVCSGVTEIEITFRVREQSLTLRLCRTHAHDVVRQIEEATLMLDGRDFMDLMPQEKS